MTPEDVQKKAAELSVMVGSPVVGLLFLVKDEEVIGYLKSPSRMLKLRFMDQALTGAAYSSVSVMLPELLIKEESDPRILSEKPEHDTFFMGAVTALYNQLTIAINQAEKKN